MMCRIKRRRPWAPMMLVLLALTMLVGGEAWSAASAQRGGGGRGGGARGGSSAYRAPRHHGSVRPQGHGSVRHYRQPTSTSRPGTAARPSSAPRSGSAGRSGSAARPSSARRSTVERPSSAPRGGASRPPARQPGRENRSQRSSIQRTPTYGSLHNRSAVERSVADRRRDAAPDGPRSLRDLGHEPGHLPADRRDHIRERRRELGDDARECRHRGRRYYWWRGRWWSPYYYGNDVWYATTYPDEGLAVDTLPDDVEVIETDDGTWYLVNGVYYERLPDGSFVVSAGPDSDRPDPVTIVQRACDVLARQAAFTMIATDTMDHVQDSGQKIQTQTTRTVHVARPDRLAATATGDDADRSLWFDGRQITILDNLENVYTQGDAPKTIDAMIDFLVTQLSVGLPLTDFFYADPFSRIQGALQAGEHLGLAEIGGVTCHHLSFSTGDADWQLWVDAGEDPLLKMIAITYTTAPQSPTYRAEIEHWDLSPTFGSGTFAASIPAGIEMIPLTTPQSVVRGLEDALDRLREDNRRVDEYIAAQRTIDLYSQIAHKPEAAQRIEAEKAKLAELGPVSQDEIDAYLERKHDLERELNLARRAARSP
ncbi:MAG: DUF6515 family protein [Planctomycetota bacterium]